MKETVVISVGGSLICPPKGIDVAFLRALRTFVESHIKKGYRFVIITGGGRTAREYQHAARDLKALNREDLDWLGIHSTRLNGHLLRTMFRKYAAPALVKSLSARIPDAPVVIAAGTAPGWSTDYVAVRLAKKAKASRVINLSDIAYLYTADPKKDKNATPIYETTWANFRKMLPKKWDPGTHTPFDPVASREAEHSGIEVAMIAGKSLSELSNYLSGKEFKGTRIA